MEIEKSVHLAQLPMGQVSIIPRTWLDKKRLAACRVGE
jgi:hypothetical protein